MAWTPSPEEQAELDRIADRLAYEEAEALRQAQSNRDDADLQSYGGQS